MFVNKLCLVFLTAAAFLTISGCATTKRQDSLAMQSLKNQVAVLETQLAQKDQEIAGLNDALRSANQTVISPVEKNSLANEIKSHPAPKHIQAALKNSGFYAGKIDGKMGKQTRQAIKDFQKANNLPADGKVGKKTWNLLKGYLHRKVK